MLNSTLLLASLFLVQSAHANLNETIKNAPQKVVNIAKSLNGHTLICGAPDKKGNKEIAVRDFSLAMKILPHGSVQVVMKALDPKNNGEVGFGGEEFVESEAQYSSDWMILSIGDDGRATYMIQNPKNMSFEEAKCAGDRSAYANFIASKTVGMDGMVDSLGMNCCLQ